MTSVRITVGIATRNRPDALPRCLRSLQIIAHLEPEVLVFDDGSTTPVAELVASLDLPVKVRVLRDENGPGLLVARNRLVQAAAAPAVLLLDDDAGVLTSEAIERGLEVLDADPQVGAIAFAQSDRHGTPWDASMQPARSAAACYVAAYIGFAHLVRRTTFLELGGYRESLVFYGEEKEFCLRLIDAGYRTVYLPDALVMHEPDPAGRSQQRYLRHVTRNDCLNALYNEPWHRLAWMLPARLALYFRMRRAWRIQDPGGFSWILHELAANARDIRRARRPVSAETIALWKRLRQTPEPYQKLRAQSSSL